MPRYTPQSGGGQSPTQQSPILPCSPPAQDLHLPQNTGNRIRYLRYVSDVIAPLVAPTLQSSAMNVYLLVLPLIVVHASLMFGVGLLRPLPPASALFRNTRQ